jgi:hypothetical protein
MHVEFVFFIINKFFPQAIIFTQILERPLLLCRPEVTVHPHNTSLHTTVYSGILAAVSKIMHTWELLPGNLAVCSILLIQAVSLSRGGWGHFAPLLHKCCNAYHEVQGGTFACVSNIKMHVRIHWICHQEIRQWFRLIMIDFVCTLLVLLWLLAHAVVLIRIIAVFSRLLDAVNFNMRP